MGKRLWWHRAPVVTEAVKEQGCAGRSAMREPEIRGQVGVRKGLFRIWLGGRRDRGAGRFIRKRLEISILG